MQRVKADEMNAERYLDVLEKSRILSPSELASIQSWVAQQETQHLLDADEVGQQLLDQGVITPWQNERLLRGQFQRLILGKYRLLAPLGNPQTSHVYLAEHRVRRIQVAIKILPRELTTHDNCLETVEREVRTFASLNHPNLIRTSYLENEGKSYFFVMEYITGCDLFQLVRQTGPLEFQQAANYICQVAQGLSYAHPRRGAHRDIKPEKLLVDHQHTVHILNRGMDRVARELFRGSGGFIRYGATAVRDYDSPELAGETYLVDNRADIYSLGLTFYYLLTARPPFRPGAARVTDNMWNSPQRLWEFRPDLPEDLVVICQRMIAYQRNDRYQSANQLVTALETWLATS